MRVAAMPKAFLRATRGYRDVFSAQQLAHARGYMLGLSVGREGRNIQDIAGLYVNGCDQATLNHFLTDAKWSLDRLWETHRAAVVRKLARQRPGRVFVSLDDTVTVKRYGRRMEGAGYHYSKPEKGVVWGHNAVAAIASVGGESLAWGVEMYRPRRACSGKEFRSKIDLALGLMETFRGPSGAAVTVLADSWYLCKRLVGAARARGFDWVFACKRNRVVHCAGRRVAVSRLIRRLSLDALKPVTVAGRRYVVMSCAVDFPGIGPGQLVISAEMPRSGRRMKRRDLWVMATNRRDWTARMVLAQYLQRRRIEDFFKDAKLHLGLGEYQMRKARGIQRHWALVACVHAVLRHIGHRHKCRTIGQAVRWLEDQTQEATMKWAHARGRRGVRWRSICAQPRAA